jgi:hypothetical protein
VRDVSVDVGAPERSDRKKEEKIKSVDDRLCIALWVTLSIWSFEGIVHYHRN